MMSAILVNLRFIYLNNNILIGDFTPLLFVNIALWKNCVFKTTSNSPFLNGCFFILGKPHLLFMLSWGDATFILSILIWLKCSDEKIYRCLLEENHYSSNSYSTVISNV